MAETRKDYLDSVGGTSPWKLLKREVDRGCLVDADSPAHPDKEAEDDESFCAFVQENNLDVVHGVWAGNVD